MSVNTMYHFKFDMMWYTESKFLIPLDTNIVCTHTHTHTHMHTEDTYTVTRIYIHTHTHTHAHRGHIHSHMYIHTCMHTDTQHRVTHTLYTYSVITLHTILCSLYKSTVHTFVHYLSSAGCSHWS